MTLLEICQPLIDYVVECRRRALAGADLNRGDVFTEINRKIDTMREEAANSPELAAEVDKIMLPMVFFVDFMIKEGPFEFSSTWRELGKSMYNELSGDEKFFDILDKELNDPSSAATERLGVMYQLLGTGFSGCYNDQPQELERKLRICALRVGADMHENLISDISDKCTAATDSRAMFKSPYKRTRLVFLCSLIFLALALIFNRMAFLRATQNLRELLEECANLGVDDAIKQSTFEFPHELRMDESLKKASENVIKAKMRIGKHKPMEGNRL
ncbi:MAG: DotU family type IV/VI secretion system protein [Lentisphaerae bacterium]|nr:DotU family type IV/VI secretion system protein [Lentisphaerota bacterium]MCP4100686.1 DotU family type IV/VI secretion system protein [Lentisphaerota bacterium]